MPDTGTYFYGNTVYSNPTRYASGHPEDEYVLPSDYARFQYQKSGDAMRDNFSAAEAEKARVFNSAEAAKNRDFQEYMSNTAYSRAVADMKNAGINPMMAAGAAASTPSGSAATSPSASAASGNSGSNIRDIIGKIAGMAIAKGLAAKFTNSALAAASNKELVGAKVKALAAQEKAYTARAARDVYTFDSPAAAQGAYDFINSH